MSGVDRLPLRQSVGNGGAGVDEPQIRDGGQILLGEVLLVCQKAAAQLGVVGLFLGVLPLQTAVQTRPVRQGEAHGAHRLPPEGADEGARPLQRGDDDVVVPLQKGEAAGEIGPGSLDRLIDPLFDDLAVLLQILKLRRGYEEIRLPVALPLPHGAGGAGDDGRQASRIFVQYRPVEGVLPGPAFAHKAEYPAHTVTSHIVCALS